MSVTVQMALVHCFLMNLTLAAAARYNWWTRDADSVSTANALVSELTMPLFGLAELVECTMVLRLWCRCVCERRFCKQA